MKKKVLFAFMLILGIMIFGTVYASAATEGIFTYDILPEGVEITDCSEMARGSIVIPDTIEGFHVTSIGYNAFSDCYGITSVTLPDSITSIDTCAFIRCYALNSINIPFGVTYLGSSAFEECSSLTSITLPSGITAIDDETFSKCIRLNSINIPFGVTSIGDSAFTECSSLTSVTIPESVTAIGNDAFSYCSGLTSITVPFGVTSIGNDAFSDCTNLNNITLPDSVTSIGYSVLYNTKYYDDTNNWENNVLYIGKHLIDAEQSISGSYSVKNGTLTIASNAFSSCSKLTSVTIPDSVISIGYAAFYNTGYYNTSANWENNVLYIGKFLLEAKTGISKTCHIKDGTKMICESAFTGCSKLAGVFIPDSVIYIGDGAFSGCSTLTNVIIGNNTASIGNNAFDSCNSLTSIIIPDSVTTIGAKAFCKCNKLSSVSIGNNVRTIGNMAFYNCNNLTLIEIPDSVTSIGDDAFCDCYGLTTVDIGNDVRTIGAGAFSYCYELTSVTIPDSVTYIGRSAFASCSNLTTVTLPDKITFIGDNLFYNCTKLTDVTIPDNVTYIGAYAFYKCEAIASLVIPDTVKYIGNRAFDGMMTSIAIPESVMYIGEGAFVACDTLTRVDIFDLEAWCNIKFVGIFANPLMHGCHLYLNGTLVTDLVIPDSITAIKDYAFYCCKSLTSVTIPDSVTSIGIDAFWECDALETVYYGGNELQWLSINFNTGNGDLTGANIVYNYVKKTYSFVTNCDVKLPKITDYAIYTMPIVENEGKKLIGWYDNASLSGTPVTFPYNGTATTLYAAWTDKSGENFDDAFMAKANKHYTVTTTESGQVVYYKFVPKCTGEYRFYSVGELDTYCYLYNSDKDKITYDDDSGDNNNFYLDCELIAGETYYIGVKQLYGGTGSFSFVIETDCVPGTKTVYVTASSGETIFISLPSYLPEDSVVILVCYNNGSFVEMEYELNKNENIYFIANNKFDSAKIMVWDSFKNMTPLCEAEIVV